MLPSYLQAMPEDTEMEDVFYKEVRDMNERELEHVRYRCTRAFTEDAGVVATANKVRVGAKRKLCDPRVDIAEAFEDAGPGVFIVHAKKRCLQVTTLKADEADGLRSEHSELFSKLPATVHRKVGEKQLETPLWRAQAVNQLVMKHDGEIAELDRFRVQWVLMPVSDNIKEELNHEQWSCLKDAKEVGGVDEEFGHPGAIDDALITISNEIKRVASSDDHVSTQAL